MNCFRIVVFQMLLKLSLKYHLFISFCQNLCLERNVPCGPKMVKPLLQSYYSGTLDSNGSVCGDHRGVLETILYRIRTFVWLCQYQCSIKGPRSSCPGDFEIQYTVFPFGLASAPQVFIKLVAIVAVAAQHLRKGKYSLTVICYLDKQLV